VLPAQHGRPRGVLFGDREAAHGFELPERDERCWCGPAEAGARQGNESIPRAFGRRDDVAERPSLRGGECSGSGVP
jgi:hypothetical protein